LTELATRAERALDWPGCGNVRDLGGLPTEDGTETRRGVVLRGASPYGLAAVSWQPLLDAGVTTILDLRSSRELTDLDRGAPVRVVRVSLWGEDDAAYLTQIEELVAPLPDEGARFAAWYLHALEHRAAGMAEALAAIADVRDGAVLVHCAVGKDRTGLVSALLLANAGVAAEVVADDYARSAPLHVAPRAAMVAVLEELERRHGTVAGYLRASGLDDARVEALRVKLREDA
jgi:hypothetical protein